MMNAAVNVVGPLGVIAGAVIAGSAGWYGTAWWLGFAGFMLFVIGAHRMYGALVEHLAPKRRKRTPKRKPAAKKTRAKR